MKWLPREEQCCGNCSAAKEDDSLVNPETGEKGIFCRANPPIVVIEMISDPKNIGKKKATFHSRFAAMYKQGWCRQWGPIDDGKPN